MRTVSSSGTSAPLSTKAFACMPSSVWLRMFSRNRSPVATWATPAFCETSVGLGALAGARRSKQYQNQGSVLTS